MTVIGAQDTVLRAFSKTRQFLTLLQPKWQTPFPFQETVAIIFRLEYEDFSNIIGFDEL